MKRTVPVLIAAAVGFVLILSYFVPFAASWGDLSTIWFDILAAFAFVLGGGNLLKMHLQKISDQRAGWGFSLVTIVTFLAVLTVGLLKVGVHPEEQTPDRPWSGDYLQEGSAFWWSYQYVVSPLTSTMFAMLAFFVASAAFRAFRAKNVEAVLLLGTAFVILLGRTYVGVALTEGLPEPLQAGNVSGMIMDVFNLAGNRAIKIGIALGVVSTSLKILLGVDRSYLGSEQD